MKLVEILQHRENFNQVEADIAKFVLDNPQSVINLSVREFASQLFISPSAIVRFTKKIGLAGYSDFKMKVASELTYFSKDNTTLVALDLPVASKQTVRDIAKTMMNLHSQTLLDVYLDLELKNITMAGDLILHSDWITIFAKGESILAAEALHQKLLRIGFNSHLEALHGFQLVKPIRPNIQSGLSFHSSVTVARCWSISESLLCTRSRRFTSPPTKTIKPGKAPRSAFTSKTMKP